MKIIKKDEEVTYRRSETTVTLEINGKTLRVYIHEDYDDMGGSDYDLDEEDKALLTEDELEELEDEDMWSLLRMEITN